MFIDYFRVIFTNSSLINMLFLALAVISIILAVIFYNLGKKIRLPTYAVRNLNLIKERKVGMNGLRISYQKQYIKNLSLTLRQQAKKILIDFDYFDKDEGIIVQIFHTGKLSRDLEIQGIIKGAGTVRRLGMPFMFNIHRPIDVMNKYAEKIPQKYKR